ncbi:MAG TPA: hypothetical protein VK841_12865 [Polyangiaceae bacterium]|jgi:hypothetical protein|nr:hypothetical protein [Polyangiaceae bacterium]
MTIVVAAANAGQALSAGWPLTSASVRAASRVDFRQLLAREEAGIRQEEAFASGTQASLAASAMPKAPLPSGTAASPHTATAAEAVTRRAATHEDPLDPLNRHRASLAPPDAPLPTPSFAPVHVPAGFGSAAPATPEAALRAMASLEHLVPSLVRRVAWSGDARRGTARLEIGAGELAGSTLLVHADEGRVQVHLSVPPGVDAASWQRRIAERLASRNISAQSVEVA